MKRYLLLSPAAAESASPPAKPIDKSPDTKPAEKPAEKEAEKPLTGEELVKRQRELKDMTRGGKRPKPAEKKPEDKKVEEKKLEKPEPATEKKPEEKAAEKPVEKKPDPAPKAAPAKAPAREEPDVSVPPPIGLDRREPVSDEKKVPELKSSMELTAGDKRKLRVIQQMEDDGSAPKGHAERVMRFWESEAKHIEEWEKANPGKEYDENAEDHEAWYAKHEVTYDPDSFDISRDNLVRNEALAQSDGKRDKEKTAERRNHEFKDAQPKMAQKTHRAVMDMVAQASPELAALMGDGDARKLDDAVTKAMTEKDGVATEILQETAEELAVLTTELQRLTEFDDIYQPAIARPHVLQQSGRRFYPHNVLLDFMNSLEAEMLSYDPEKTVKGGKRLVSNDAYRKEFNRLLKSGGTEKEKHDAIDALESKYYTLTETDFHTGLVAHYATQAKKEIEKFGKRYERRTPKKPKDEPEKPQDGESKAAEEKKEDEPAERERTRSPSTASASDMVDFTKKGTGSSAEDAKKLVDRSRGR